MKKLILKELIPPWYRQEINFDKLIREAYNTVIFERTVYLIPQQRKYQLFNVEELITVEYTGEKALSYTIVNTKSPYGSHFLEIELSRMPEAREELTISYTKPCSQRKFTPHDTEWLDDEIIKHIQQTFIKGSQPFNNIKNKTNKENKTNGKN